MSFTNLPHIHEQNKLLFLVDSAPIVLCLFSLLGGFKQVSILKIPEKLSASFEELKGTKTFLTKNETLRLSAMVESTKIIEKISDISTILNNNTTCFYNGVRNIAESASHIKEAAITSSNLINKVSNFSNDIANFSNKCLEETKNSKRVGDKGLCFVKETVGNMGSILAEVLLQKNEFKAMISNVEEANKMLNFIEEISSKTKSLAMNASIESSRAGEFGKGFNIIAKEVRQLSDMSKTSTDSIITIFKKLNESVNSISLRINNIEQCISKAHIVSKEMDTGIVALIESLDISEKQIKRISDMTFEENTEIVAIEKDSSNIKNLALNMDTVLSQSENMLNNNEKLIHDLYNAINDFNLILNKQPI